MSNHSDHRAQFFMSRFRLYGQKNMVAPFALGMSSGFPLTLVISIMGLWLSYSGVSKSDVGLFALISSFYAWKFIWSPAIDNLSLGPITKILGQRRGWLLTIQALMALSIMGLAQYDPVHQLYNVAVLAAIIAFLSASQDIVIDAYRIEIIEGEDQGYSAAAYVYGYRVANYLAAVAVLAVAEIWGWQPALMILPLFLLPGAFAVLWVGEPDQPEIDNFLDTELAAVGKNTITGQLYKAVYLPFKEFTNRHSWALVLLFIILLKAGDAVTAIMTSPLLVEMNFTPGDLLFANKTVGMITLLLGVGLGAILYKRIGTYKALLLTSILMMVTNLGFAWLWMGGTETWRLAVVIGLENFASGLGTTVAIAYFASLCNINFTATQYALLSSLAAQSRAIFSAPSGYVAEAVGWVEFFVIATFMALPAIVLLWVLWKRDIGRNQLNMASDKG